MAYQQSTSYNNKINNIHFCTARAGGGNMHSLTAIGYIVIHAAMMHRVQRQANPDHTQGKDGGKLDGNYNRQAVRFIRPISWTSDCVDAG